MRNAPWPALVALLLCAGAAFSQYGYDQGSHRQGRLAREVQSLRKTVKSLEAKLRTLEKHVVIRGSNLELKASTVRIKAGANLELNARIAMDVKSYGRLNVRSYSESTFDAGARLVVRSAQPIEVQAPALHINEGKRPVAAVGARDGKTSFEPGGSGAASIEPCTALRVP